jgi:hypothetical protein
MFSSRRRYAYLAVVMALGMVCQANAQSQTFFPTNTIIAQPRVGGISIDANGVLENAAAADKEVMEKFRQQMAKQVSGEVKQAGMRKISLARLNEALRDAVNNKTPVPDELRYLAGMQRVQFVFVYPEQHDIVLAGPGEGWKLNPDGSVVGATTGRAVLLLDDLLVALRTASTSNNGGMSCSIEPTPEGLTRLNQMKARAGATPEEIAAQWEELLGPQTITITGVPASSHFARVMVAADYRMKRLAMKFEEPPVRGLPSYLDMVPGSGSPAAPRWWLATSYEPLAKAADGLSWELRGQGVKAMAEEDFFSTAGKREKSVKASPVVQKWADNMTAKYDELSTKDTIFGELRNCMDLAVVSALILREDMQGKAGCTLATLLDAQQVPTPEFASPKQVATKASFVRKAHGTLVTASGGVQILPWQAAEKQSPAAANLGQARDSAAPKSDKWWWN